MRKKSLETNLMNEKLTNPIGLATGIDKSTRKSIIIIQTWLWVCKRGTITPQKTIEQPKTKSLD